MKGIEVRFRDQLVGHFSGLDKPNDQIPIEFSILEDPNAKEFDWIPSCKRIWIQNKRRFVNVDVRAVADILNNTGIKRPSELLRKDIAYKYLPVPPYAEVRENHYDHEYQFHWWAMDPTLEQYEVLFDNPMFHPV